MSRNILYFRGLNLTQPEPELILFLTTFVVAMFILTHIIMICFVLICLPSRRDQGLSSRAASRTGEFLCDKCVQLVLLNNEGLSSNILPLTTAQICYLLEAGTVHAVCPQCSENIGSCSFDRFVLSNTIIPRNTSQWKSH